MARRKNNSNNVGSTRHANRNAQQDKTGRGKVKDRHDGRAQTGTELVMSERAVNNEDYKLDWFKPTESQKEIIHSMCVNTCTIVSASSGTGKTTSVIWQALRELKRGNYKKIMFVKTAVESCDDSIGFLPNDADSKLKPHFEATRGVFMQFMSEAKLAMEEKRGRIEFKIPNFIQGATFDDTLMILDEMQQVSPAILKLILERVGKGSAVAVLGDKKQRYAFKKREDGFSFLVNMVTDVDDEGRYSAIDSIGYVEIPASENMRSDFSRLIVGLYEEKL